jgi:hypothetical protein
VIPLQHTLVAALERMGLVVSHARGGYQAEAECTLVVTQHSSEDVRMTVETESGVSFTFRLTPEQIIQKSKEAL